MENVAFGLTARGTPKRETAGRVADALEATGMAACAKRYPVSCPVGGHPRSRRHARPRQRLRRERPQDHRDHRGDLRHQNPDILFVYFGETDEVRHNSGVTGARPADTRPVDVAATVFHQLGIVPDPSWGLDGKPVKQRSTAPFETLHGSLSGRVDETGIPVGLLGFTHTPPSGWAVVNNAMGRQEGGQTARVLAAFNGGTPTVVRSYTADVLSQPQSLTADVPAGAVNVSFRFHYTGSNDWYWAIDGIAVTAS